MEAVIDGLGKLTASHRSSRSGEPVLVLDRNFQRRYNPADLVNVGGVTQPAWLLVKRWMDATELSGVALGLAAEFVGLGEETARG